MLAVAALIVVAVAAAGAADGNEATVDRHDDDRHDDDRHDDGGGSQVASGASCSATTASHATGPWARAGTLGRICRSRPSQSIWLRSRSRSATAAARCLRSQASCRIKEIDAVAHYVVEQIAPKA